MKTYYDVAVGVLLTAGVAERNPAYEPTEPFSEEILITRPDRIVSFDETRVELDCTSGGKGKTDRCLRESIHDDGETIVTKSNSTATAMCGRTGDGKALPVMVVFASGDSFHFQWAPVITSTYFKDRDGNPLEWRYRSNKKGSLNEEGYVDFLRSIVHPAVGYPQPETVSLATRVCVSAMAWGHIAGSLPWRRHYPWGSKSSSGSPI